MPRQNGDMARDDQRYVTDLCDRVVGLAASREHIFDWLRGDPYPANPRGRQLPVDAYWAHLNLVMEFNERQHTEGVALLDKLDVLTVSGVPRGGPDGQRQRYDRRRDALIPAHRIQLVRIHLSDFEVRRHRIVPAEGDLEFVRQALKIGAP